MNAYHRLQEGVWCLRINVRNYGNEDPFLKRAVDRGEDALRRRFAAYRHANAVLSNWDGEVSHEFAIPSSPKTLSSHAGGGTRSETARL